MLREKRMKWMVISCLPLLSVDGWMDGWMGGGWVCWWSDGGWRLAGKRLLGKGTREIQEMLQL